MCHLKPNLALELFVRPPASPFKVSRIIWMSLYNLFCLQNSELAPNFFTHLAFSTRGNIILKCWLNAILYIVTFLDATGLLKHSFKLHSPTECVTDLDLQREMIIFKSILTTFEASVIFRGSWGSIENWLKPKTKPPYAISACPNLWNAL